MAPSARRRKAAALKAQRKCENDSDDDEQLPPLIDNTDEEAAAVAPIQEIDENEDSNGDEGEDDDDDDDNLNCLHCQDPSTEVQVRCDECSAYICNGCHWCHEFQANHEIRVCDRCDAFYCRGCDEMDQCDDCAEVVCASCSTLLSCKFCGGGLCEECATACGRCGIVLCSRDAKFAVDCDTCRLSYCLVCLASGSKDPCVRCGHRPSKRMEQLVHLRLKSIYKAFKQNSSTTAKSSNTRERQNDDPDEDHVADDPAALLQAAASAAKNSANANKQQGKHRKQRSDSVSSSSTQDRVNRYKEEKEKADAAAAALLAELEEEEEAVKSKKNRKKRKKAKQQAKIEHVKIPARVLNAVTAAARVDNDDESDGSDRSREDSTSAEERKSPPTSGPKPPPEPKPAVVEEDPLEKEMCSLVAVEDMDGLEKLLLSIKGVPGRAVLRKNAKKALKRLRLEHCPPEEEEIPEPEPEAALRRSSSRASTPIGPCDPNGLLKIVSHLHNKPSAQDTAAGRTVARIRPASAGGMMRSECVMHMSPGIVGWVIGKGGQRIRDLMEESGARIWIDQDSMGQNDARIVYVSGQRKNVDHAVDSIKDLVKKAPTMSSPHSRQHTPTGEHFGHVAKSTSIGKAPPMPDATDGSSPKNEVALQPRSAGRNVDGRSRQEITCDPRFVPLLIGRRGWTIKNIQDSTGAKVDIDQTVTPRKITVSGLEENVEKAIRMVRDVLSYPQAQLQGLDEAHADTAVKAAPRITVATQPSVQSRPAASGLPLSPAGQRQTAPPVLPSPPAPSSPARPVRAHSPPSSLIMTGDAKSTISASSSLSSTPEPSMSSSSKPSIAQVAVAPGPMLSPTQTREVFPAGLSDAPQQNAFNQIPPQSPLVGRPVYSQGGTNNVFGSGDQFFRGVPQPGPHPGSPMGHSLQQQSPMAQDRPTFMPPNGNGFGSHPNHSPMQRHQHGAFQPSQPNFAMGPQQPNGFGNNPVNNGGGPALWDGPGGHPVQMQRNPQQGGGGVGGAPQDYRLNAAVEFLVHSKQRSAVISPAGAGTKEVIGAPSKQQGPMGPSVQDFIQGRDDAQMVDSLFGPADSAAAGSSLLTGIQGLSINNEAASTGLWGTTGNQIDSDVKNHAHAQSNPFANGPVIPFTGIQPTLSTTADRKPQSRFAWGESSGS